jgi:hypothetical protein
MMNKECRMFNCGVKMPSRRVAVSLLLLLSVWLCGGAAARAAKLTVDVGDAPGVTFVGAFNRWDLDGNPRKPVDPNAKIDAPQVDAVAQNAGGGAWVFSDLAPGTYDLVIMAGDRVRVEGWTYAPVLEFDPFFAADSTMEEDVAQFIADDIRKARHYENKVEPLSIGGDGDKAARVLVMLIRDQQTSYESHFPGAATMRFEIWQYDWQYGGWVKNKRTRVLHRVMLHRDELRKWTWLWAPKLGGIEVKQAPVEVQYAVPDLSGPGLKGLRPY